MTGLGWVFSGGGARGAYEAGVLGGIRSVLADAGAPMPAGSVFSGTSVGAINATWCASHAEAADWEIGRLLSHWHGLEMEAQLDVNLGSLWRLLNGPSKGEPDPGWSVLSGDALEVLLRDEMPWEQLHRNVEDGTVGALIVPALRVSDGTTAIFIEKTESRTFRRSRDPRRNPVFTTLTPAHVLASAAFPFLFPARQVDGEFYCDGGLRFNTPIAPAIRSGCDRLVVVSLRSDALQATPAAAVFPRPVFLAGKLLNALLLDPLPYDLEVLRHTNDLVDVVTRSADAETQARIDAHHIRARGIPYRRIDTLVLAPSRNVGHMASQHAEGLKLRRMSSWLLGRMASLGTQWESDLLSFIMFDGAFARQLTELGHDDTRAKRDEVLRFFSA